MRSEVILATVSQAKDKMSGYEDIPGVPTKRKFLRAVALNSWSGHHLTQLL